MSSNPKAPEPSKYKTHKFKIFFKSILDEYLQEVLFLDSVNCLVSGVLRQETKLNQKVNLSLKSCYRPTTNASARVFLEVWAKLGKFGDLNEQMIEWVLEIDNFEHQFKSTIMNYYRQYLGSEFSFEADLKDSFRNESILESRFSKNQYQSFNIYSNQSSDYSINYFASSGSLEKGELEIEKSEENQGNSKVNFKSNIKSFSVQKNRKRVRESITPYTNRHRKNTFKYENKSVSISKSKSNRVNQQQLLKKNKRHHFKRIPISVNKKEMFKQHIIQNDANVKPIFQRISNAGNTELDQPVPLRNNYFPVQENFIRSRRKAQVQESNSINLSNDLQNRNKLQYFPPKTIEEGGAEDFIISFEVGNDEKGSEEGQFKNIQRRLKSKIFLNSTESDGSFNVFSSNQIEHDNDLREEKIKEIEKNKLSNIKKEFDFISIMVEISYASYRRFVKGLQEVVFLQTLHGLLGSDLVFSRFMGNYPFLMSNDSWLNNLSSFEENELFFVDNFETNEEKQLIKTTKDTDQWTTSKDINYKNQTRTSDPVQSIPKQSTGITSNNLLNPSMQKLTKKASQLISIHSAEELSQSNQKLYSHSSSKTINPDPVTQDSLSEKFVCVESFNNFYLLYLKLKQSFVFQRSFQDLIVYLETILYKKERIAYFGDLFSEYTSEGIIPKHKDLGRFFGFEHDFQQLCKNKFSKKVELIIKVIFNSCDALPRVSLI